MINYNIEHQERFSRGELLLRTFFGPLYIGVPHFFLLFFMLIASSVLRFFAWWIVLFTGQYPKGFFNFQVNYLRWITRVQARFMHLRDGYPSFGLNAQDPGITVDVPYPERLSRGLLILRYLFGAIYCILPHYFILTFRLIGTYVLIILAWFVVLFTGKYPKSWHNFNVGTFRWIMRVNVYMMFMSDTYPPFRGKP